MANSLSEIFQREETENTKRKPPPHINLAPTDKADQHGVYRAALQKATSDEQVLNIALTGPYGSGKSSIIQTFLKEYKGHPLNISLAAFLPENDAWKKTVPIDEGNTNDKGKQSTKSKLTTQEIERSILQQMLYVADASSLPLSRFKRIQSPKWWPWLTSFFITIGLLSCLHLFHIRAEVLTESFWSPEGIADWSKVTSFFLAILFIWQLLRHVYVNSLGLSLKSISLKNLEITPDDAKEESILNRHLDEIIYFFQSTKYDLVIIEDLDRFDNPDIFVTLREINSLINKNEGVGRKIRFLYALRDNMFVNTDRTKFFEYIIPVIPIINSSNSVDKILEQVKRLSLEEQLDRQFLREVSRYLTDMRLILNIFSEYEIYIDNLDSKREGNLDAHKLLAVLIYKNVLPSDFEALHRGKGTFAEILGEHDSYIASTERSLKEQIVVLEQKVSDTEKQNLSDLAELRSVYAMAIISKLPSGYSLIQTTSNNNININSLFGNEIVDQLVEHTRITALYQHYSQAVDISNIQYEVNPNKTFEERKGEIEFKAEEFRLIASSEVRRLRKKIAELRTMKFHEMLRSNAESTDRLFDQFGDNKELLRYLMFEGYLDDTYYLYISLFHSGRLSPNDNKYILKIRGYINPEPHFQIDNPHEVIAEMRTEDFGQAFVLNKVLIDCMLADQTEYGAQVAKFIKFVSSSFSECEDFFATYYETGRFNAELMASLFDSWSGYCSALISSTNSTNHIARLIAHLPEEKIESLDHQSPSVAEFISTCLAEILSQGIDFEPSRLALLQFEIEHLNGIQPYPDVARVISDEGLYEITPENIEFIFAEILLSKRLDDLKTKNYTTILKSEEKALINKIESQIEEYVRNVLLKIDSNSGEEIDAIIKLINHEEIDLELLKDFLERQTAKLSSLGQVPERLHALVFELQKIDATWENCLGYINSEAFDASVLTGYLQQSATLSVLSEAPIEDTDPVWGLCSFLYENDEFTADTYRTYIQALPKQFEKFPEKTNHEKIRIVIEAKKIVFNPENFSGLSNDRALQVLFLEKNIETYLGKIDQFEIDDDLREELLDTSINDQQKLEIIGAMDMSAVASKVSRASTIGQVLHRTGAEMTNLTTEAILAIISHSTPVETKVSLLNKYHRNMEVVEIRETLKNLPWPYSEIKLGRSRPKIPNTAINLQFVEWLKSRRVISSFTFSTGIIGNKIRINNRRK